MFGTILAKLRKGAAPAAIRAAAEKAYAAEAKATPGEALSPAKAKRAIAEKVGRPVEGIVDPVYFDKNGRAFPLPAAAAKTARSLAVAIRKRRDGGGTLGRWESVASAASETLARPVSVAEAKRLYAKGGGDLETSYTGRGTRVGAPGTYEDLASAVEPS